MSGDVYYPSCWVLLRIRFEDYEAVPPPQFTPPIPDTDPVDYGFQLIEKEIVPLTCNVTLNSYRNADEARVTLPMGQLPIDPRTIRAATIQIFMGSVKPETWAENMGPLYGESTASLVGPTEKIFVQEGIDRDGFPPRIFTQSNEVFRGYVDDWEAVMDGDDAISITCRDVSSILIDAQMPTQGLVGIPKNIPLDEVIRLIVVGDLTAPTIRPPDTSNYPRRIDSKRNLRRVQARLDAVTEKLERANSAFLEQGGERLAAQVARLTAKQTALLAALATSGSVAAAADAVPILAQRYGLPALRGLKVVNNTGEELPTLSEIKPPTYFDSGGGPKKARSAGSSEQISYWDFITDLVVSAGFLCYIRSPLDAEEGGGTPSAELVINLPNTYYQRPGKEVRTFSYGYNVDSLSINRSFTGVAVPTGITVSAIEAKTGEPISRRFPADPLVNRPGANDVQLGDTVEYRTILLKDRIPGDNAGDTLLRVAESLYQQFARGEFVVAIETTTLGAYPSNYTTGVADLFQLRAGDPIKVQITPTASGNTTQGGQIFVTQAGEFAALGTAEKAARLVQSYGFPAEAAARAALSAASNLIQEIFYTQEVAINFNARSGFSFNIKAINYLDARNALDSNLAEFGTTGELIQSLEELGL